MPQLGDPGLEGGEIWLQRLVGRDNAERREQGSAGPGKGQIADKGGAVAQELGCEGGCKIRGQKSKQQTKCHSGGTKVRRSGKIRLQRLRETMPKKGTEVGGPREEAKRQSRGTSGPLTTVRGGRRDKGTEV